MMQNENVVLVIMGSTRAGRVCPLVSDWVIKHGRSLTPFRYESIDLAHWPLPMDDEPDIPASGIYRQAHTREWSENISRADAVIFVSPQYNWGYPAVLKNAIDHLYREWRDKPAVIVTYGAHGGTKCSDQLKQVASAVKLRVVATTPTLVLPAPVAREGGEFDPELAFADQVHAIQSAFAELSKLLS